MAYLETSRVRPGFTIVELLVVIVVIGILAALTIVAYSGIQSRATVANLSSSLSQTHKKLLAHQIENGSFPMTLTAANINNSANTTYQYSVNNSLSPQTYCVTATSRNVSYRIDSTTTTIASGGCSGHAVNGVPFLTNYANNPALQTNTTNYNGTSVTGSVRVAIADLPGFSFAYQADTSISGSRINHGTSTGVGEIVIGQTYNARVWAKLTAGLSLTVQTTDSIGTVYSSRSYGTATGGWQLLETNFVPTATTWRLVVRQTSAGTGVIAMTGVMVTDSAASYNYADGNSSGWTWSGTAGNSVSSGFAL